jgi:hypothetical protein
MNKLTMLKLGLFQVTYDSSKFTKEQKQELLKFVKEASLKDLKELLTEEVLTIVTAAAFTGVLIAAALETYREYFSKAAKLCKHTGWTSIERHLCIIDEEVKGKQKQISSLKGATSKCSKLDGPYKQNKCKGTIAKEVNKVESQIIKLKQEKNLYEKRLAKKKV